DLGADGLHPTLERPVPEGSVADPADEGEHLLGLLQERDAELRACAAVAIRERLEGALQVSPAGLSRTRPEVVGAKPVGHEGPRERPEELLRSGGASAGLDDEVGDGAGTCDPEPAS